MEQNKNNNLRDWSWEKEQCKKQFDKWKSRKQEVLEDSEKIL